MVGPLVAASVAGIVTYLELDQVFAFPDEKSTGRRVIRGWIATYILVNCLLAIALYRLLSQAGILEDVEAWVRGLLIGAGYLSLVRLKFATFNEQPFGFEYFYELARTYVYRRINRRLSVEREKAAQRHAEATSLPDLMTQANAKIGFDSLLNQDEKHETKAWILRVYEDSETSDDEKKLILADFIKSGSRSGHE